MAAIDWTNMYQKYRGLWVALKSDEKTVVASGKTAKTALLKAKKAGTPNPILHRVPSTLSVYVGIATL
jgi:hypothetical protein